jgi:eukaryotic-like serine/threonine-protein kinase
MARPERAAPLLERALAIRERRGAQPSNLAEVRFALARSLWGAPSTRRRALDLARAARDGYAGAVGQEKVAHTVATWVARHAPRPI